MNTELRVSASQPHGEGKITEYGCRNTRLLEHGNQVTAPLRTVTQEWSGPTSRKISRNQGSHRADTPRPNASAISTMSGDARPAFAQADRHGQLARLNVGWECHMRYSPWAAHGNQTNADIPTQPSRVRVCACVKCPGCSQTKVDEDEHVAQAHVAVGDLPPV